MEPLSQDQAVEKLFDSILDGLALTGVFSDSSLPTSFVVYAHDPDADASELDDSGPAYSHVVKKFIRWMHRLRTRTYSDQYPMGTFGHETRTSDDAACRDILENQFCILPQRGSATRDMNPGRTERVQMVLVCGSPRLRSYCEHPYANGYIDKIKCVYRECSEKSDPELRQRLQHEVLEAATSQPGFHHALTEIAFLELRREHNPSTHGIVLVNLDQGIMNYFRFTQPTDLQLQVSSSSSTSAGLRSRFFKSLRVLYPTASTAIDKYEQAYKSAEVEIKKRGGRMTERDLNNLVELFISRARRDLINHENEELHQIFRKRQLADLGSASFAILEQRRNKVLGALPTIPCKDRKDRNPERIAGTCRWFTRHPKFREWHNSESGGLLWVTAYPGCGKSVLLKHLVDTVLVASNSAVCYFFFKDDFEDQKSIVSALRCLLHQVLVQRPGLLNDKIIQKFEQDGQLLSSASELWDLLCTITCEVEVGNIVLVVDALDECHYEDRQVFIRQLVRWAENPSTPRLKILISSRLYDDIDRGLHTVGSEIHLSAENDEELEQISEEIELVITHKLNKMAAYLELTKEQRKLLHEGFTSVKHKTYLWAHLVQDEIDRMFETDTKSLRAAVQNLPRSVDAAYEKILNRSGQRDKVIRMLSIIVAAARPLNLVELAQAWALTSVVSTEDELEVKSAEQMYRILNGLCGLFVIVVEDRVYLLHQTAREFLLDKPAKTGIIGARDGTWRGSVRQAKAELVLAEICLRYFDLCGIPEWEMKFDRYPQICVGETVLACKICKCSQRRMEHDPECFTHYAIERWATHVLRSQDAGGEKLVQWAVVVTERLGSGLRWNHWMSEELKQLLAENKNKGRASTLMVACMLGLVPVVQMLQPTAAELDCALVWAVSYDRVDLTHTDLARMLLERGADCHAGNRVGTPVLALAVNKPNRAMVEMLLASGADANAANNNGRTPLIRAARSGFTDVVLLLLKHGADPNAADNNSRTPLIRAARSNSTDVVLLLLEHGADPNAADNDGDTPLICAARSNSTDVVLLLLEHGADPNAADNDGDTPLICAAHSNSADVVLLLLEHGVDPNAADKRGENALAYACKAYDPQNAHVLLDKGANPALADINGRTPLMQCCMHTFSQTKEGQIETMELLLKDSRVHVDEQDRNGHSALSHACQWDYKPAVQCLLEHGATIHAQCLLSAACVEDDSIMQMLLDADADADINTVGPYGQTALTIAAAKGNQALVRKLLTMGVDVDHFDIYGQTALYKAAEYGFANVVQSLLDHGATVNSMQDKDKPISYQGQQNTTNDAEREYFSAAGLEIPFNSGDTALTITAYSGHQGIVSMLLDHGAQVDAIGLNGMTALYVAACQGHRDIVNCLLSNGADVNRPSPDGYTPLMAALQFCRTNVVSNLLDNKADTESIDSRGRTALSVAGSDGDVEFVEMPLNYGAEVNHSDSSVYSALFTATKQSQTEVVRTLLEKGADSTRRDRDGLSVLDIATELGNLEILQLLLSTINDVNLVRSTLCQVKGTEGQDLKLALAQRISELHWKKVWNSSSR